MAFGIPRGVSLGIDYGEFKQWSKERAAKARKKEELRQRLFDQIRSAEINYERNPTAPDVIPTLRKLILEYEKFGEEYGGKGREYSGLAPRRAAIRSSGGGGGGISRGPSQAALDRQQERAAIRSRRKQESQELKDAQWLSKYETKKSELERRSTSTGVSPQENYNAQQEMIKLELERQRRETRMPGYETPEKRTQREKREAETAKLQRTAEGEQIIQSANQQLDRLIGSLDPATQSDAIAQINKLRPQLDKGASPESIIRQAQATAKSAEDLRQRKRTEEWEDWKKRTDYSAEKVNSRIKEQQTFLKNQQNARIKAEQEAQEGRMSSQSIQEYTEYQRKAAANRAYWEGLLNELPAESSTELPEITKLRNIAKTSIAGFSNTEAYWANALKSVGAGSGGGNTFGGDGMPQVGDVVDGWEFLGGDPADQNSWRQVR